MAGALLPADVFNKSQLMNNGKINPVFVDSGIPAIWDFAHSIGNVQHSLKTDRVLAGAGCGYKHLNGIAGGPGVIFQNSALLAELGQKWDHIVPTPVSGWLSHGRTGGLDAFANIDQFCLDTMHKPESVQRMRASNPEILAMRVLIANLKVISDFGVPQIMSLKAALSDFLFESLDAAFRDEIQSGELAYITPRSAEKRGATVCFSLAHVEAAKVEHALKDDEFKLGQRFEIDIRPGGDGPDTFRITSHYAHMSFTDTANLAYGLKQVYVKLRIVGAPEAKKRRCGEYIA
jgi:kynureninase